MFRHAQICLLVVTSLFVLSACATASLPSQMAASPNTTPTATSSEPGYHQMRVVQVQGGRKTSPLGESDVSNSDFKAALEASLRTSGLMQDDDAQAHLNLTASIIDLKRPIAGFNMTVISKVRYTVVQVGSTDPVFDQTIAASGTASFGSALLGVERLRKANEAAMQANIASFLTQFRASLLVPQK